MRSKLKNYRQSPRKVRLVADLVRGKGVDHAITVLSFLPKRAAAPMKKLILSAVANAGNNTNKKSDELFVRTIKVDEGTTFKRIEYRARGSSNVLKKRTSNISIELDEKKQSAKDNSQPTAGKEDASVTGKTI